MYTILFVFHVLILAGLFKVAQLLNINDMLVIELKLGTSVADILSASQPKKAYCILVQETAPHCSMSFKRFLSALLFILIWLKLVGLIFNRIRLFNGKPEIVAVEPEKLPLPVNIGPVTVSQV